MLSESNCWRSRLVGGVADRAASGAGAGALTGHQKETGKLAHRLRCDAGERGMPEMPLPDVGTVRMPSDLTMFRTWVMALLLALGIERAI